MTLAPTRGRLVAAVAVALVAGAWFWAGTWLTLEWVDQGQIVYGAWRVARGDLPYRDFDHLYGPSLFFLNGELLRWFGEDLGVIRIGLLAVKAVLAALLFLVCRAVARPGIALLVTAWFIVQWGAPLWIYATPYAGHYTLACCLAGLVVLLGRPAGRWRRACLAGVLIGAGATFKQTTGLFVALAALLVLASRPERRGERDGLAWLGRALRVVIAIGSAAVVAGYLAPTVETWTGAMLMAPPLLALVLEWLRDLPRERALAAGRPRLAGALAFGVGFAMPLLAWAAYYASQGALGDLVHDTLLGLPQLVHWFVPLSTPLPLTLVFGAALAVAAAGLATGRAAPVVLAGIASVALFTALTVIPGGGSTAAQVTQFLPVGLVWVSAPIALRDPTAETPRLIWWFGALVGLSLYPASDLPHTLMIVPAELPLLALLVEEAWSRARAPLARTGVALLVGAPMVARAGADAVSLGHAVASRPSPPVAFDRARGVWDATPQFETMHAVTARLDDLAPRGTPLLVLPSAQLLYVLADRPSALPRAELVLYLLAIDAIGTDDARALLSDDALVAELAARRPLVVRTRDAGWARIAAAFPKLRAWIDGRYEVIDTVGRVEVLRPRGQRSGG